MFRLHNAMVLAAGFATRLYPLSLEIPKPALPILNRPLIHYILDWLSDHGVMDVSVNLHYLPDITQQIVRDYKKRPLTFHFSREEEEILLTAAPLGQHRNLFHTGGTFVLVNGKIVTDIDLEPALEFHKRSGNMATLVLTPNTRREPFSHVRISRNGRIQGFFPFSAVKSRVEELNIFTGIHILEPEILDYIPENRPYDTVRHLYPELIQRGQSIRAVVAAESWMEFSTPARYLDNSMKMLRQRGSTFLSSHDVDVSTTAYLHEVIAGDRVTVADDAHIKSCILLGGNVVAPGACLEECILGPGVIVPAGIQLKRTMLVVRNNDIELKKDMSVMGKIVVTLL